MSLERFEKLIEELEASGDASDRRQVYEAVEVVLDFYRGVLARILAILEEEGEREIIDCLLSDPLLESVLRGYDLISEPPLVQLEAPGEEASPWLPLLHMFEAPAGNVTCVDAFDEPLLVFNNGGRVTVFRGRCPAPGGRGLKDAPQEGTCLTCPCHDLRFDLRDGSCNERAEFALSRLKSKVEGGVIQVKYER